MRNRQIEKSSADAAMRWYFCRRLGEEQPIAMLGRRIVYRRSGVQAWLRACEGDAA